MSTHQVTLSGQFVSIMKRQRPQRPSVAIVDGVKRRREVLDANRSAAKQQERAMTPHHKVTCEHCHKQTSVVCEHCGRATRTRGQSSGTPINNRAREFIGAKTPSDRVDRMILFMEEQLIGRHMMQQEEHFGFPRQVALSP